jgi:hypothetical protein
MSTQTIHSARKTSLNNLYRQAGQYSLTAAVAGVSLLALAEPAKSEVVVTTKTIPIPISQLGVHGIGISFANNGVDDLKLILSSHQIFGANGKNLLAVNAADGMGVVGKFERLPYASALAPGAEIGPNANFVSAACGGSYFSCPDAVRLADTFWSTFGSRGAGGPWSGNPRNRYLGVRFQMDGETHYGWVRLMVNTNVPYKMSAAVTAYAYETEPNTEIFAGLTKGPNAELWLPENTENQHGPSLGMLALGAEGMPLWRREETLAS